MMLLDGLKLLSNTQQGKCEMVFKLISLVEQLRTVRSPEDLSEKNKTYSSSRVICSVVLLGAGNSETPILSLTKLDM